MDKYGTCHHEVETQIDDTKHWLYLMIDEEIEAASDDEEVTKLEFMKDEVVSVDTSMIIALNYADEHPALVNALREIMHCNISGAGKVGDYDCPEDYVQYVYVKLMNYIKHSSSHETRADIERLGTRLRDLQAQASG